MFVCPPMLIISKHVVLETCKIAVEVARPAIVRGAIDVVQMSTEADYL